MNILRARRWRNHPVLRHLLDDVFFFPQHLICPLFIGENTFIHPELPGMSVYSLLDLPQKIKLISHLDLHSFILFPSTSQKDSVGTESLNPKGLIPKAIEIIKKTDPKSVIFADVALDPYTDHGHDGILGKDSLVDNDKTVSILEKMSLLLAGCGADFIAPSDMMDGRVWAIRRALDSHGFLSTGILSYAAKYASAFYGPFRDAVKAPSQSLDKKSYQLSPQHQNIGITESLEDVKEGADGLIIKPGICYLDILQKVKSLVHIPLVSYHVSGEYAMLRYASIHRALDEQKAVFETFHAFKRSGADGVISYYAEDYARWYRASQKS
jgi:porphobilinogen synthase